MLGRPFSRNANTAVTGGGRGRALSESAIAIDPRAAFQPYPGLVESYTFFDESDTSALVRLTSGIVLYKDIPYSRYEGTWQFHPNRIGRYLVAARPLAKAARTALRLRQFLAELPNGGLALYYPRTIRTARFQTPEFIYSGISQGQLLAGYTRLIAEDDGENQSEWRMTAARLALGLQFPVELGGVTADGAIILEGPNFRSCPEAILNGWADALLHLYDYLQVVPEREVAEFYHQSLRALTALLPYFDDPPQRLSRYSNLCPYVFRAHLALRSQSEPPAVRVEYLARESAYRDRWIGDLRQMGPAGCIYDNQIEARGSESLDISLSVAGHYDIRVEIAADCRALSFDPGATDERSTVPHPTFRRRSILPIAPYDGLATSFYIRPQELSLIAGCPTQFTKHGGENFYHSYHVSALYQLAVTTQDENERNTLTEFANRWLSYIAEPCRSPKRFIFANPERVLKTIDRSRALPIGSTLNELRARIARNRRDNIAAGSVVH